MKDNPDILFNLTERLLAGLDGLLLRIEMLTWADVQTRVISQLLYLSRHDGVHSTNGDISLGAISHQQIAQLIGVTRESVSIAMKKLHNEGLIQYKNRAIIIPDLSKLTDRLRLKLQGGLI